MLGTPKDFPKHSVVVGGGISGLLAAHRLCRAGHRVDLYERQTRLGGLIETRHLGFGLAESAAHSLRANGAVRSLFKELNLTLVPARKEARKRFLIRGGRLRAWPFHWRETLSLLGRALFAPALQPDLNLHDFGKRHLGSAFGILRAMSRGIHGSEPEELTARLAFPRLVPNPGWSLIPWMLKSKREKGVYAAAPQYGMSELIGALEKDLQRRGVAIHTGAPIPGALVEEFFSRPEKKFQLILATAAPDCGDILEAVDPQVAAALKGIPYGALSCVTVIIKAESFAEIPKGTGALSMEENHSHFLGVLYNSSSYPHRVYNEETHVSLTLMFRGAKAPDTPLVEACLFQLFQLPPGSMVEMSVSPWPRALPRYHLSLEKVWQQASLFAHRHPGLVFFGNWTGEISLRGLVESSQRFRVA